MRRGLIIWACVHALLTLTWIALRVECMYLTMKMRDEESR